MVTDMKHMMAVLWKQIKDTFKNKEILIQFVMFPVLTLIMENVVEVEGMPEQFFTNLFGVMFVGMAPLTSMASIIAEEKEKNTLRALMMSNVKPAEYLLGVGVYNWCICMLGACVIGFAGGHTGAAFGRFVLIMGSGIIVSIVIGAVIGTWSKTQMMATSLTVPVMLVFSFMPMLSMFSEGIEKVARVTYSQQIYSLIYQLDAIDSVVEPVAVIAVNMILAIILFIYAYRRSGLE